MSLKLMPHSVRIPPRGRPTPVRRTRGRPVWPIYLGLLPFFSLMLIFMIFPMGYGIVMSFTDWSVSTRGAPNFTGLENYRTVLDGESLTSRRFLKAAQNLLIYVPITVAVGLTVALGLALIVSNLPDRLYRVLRTGYFVPTVVPLFLAAGIWQWLMNSESGLVASNLGHVGIGAGVNWVNTAGWAIAMVILIDVWRSVGFNFIIFATAIQDVSPELYDAASIDGASTFQKMRHVTIPMIEPVIFFVITYSFISALQIYDVPQILTQGMGPNDTGGPNQVMLFPVMEMVRNVRAGGEAGLGRAAAEGTLLLLFIMLVTWILFKLRRTNR